MADFTYNTDATVDASAGKIFGIIYDPTQHPTLAGSDEITVSPGPVGVGTKIFADEEVIVGGDSMAITT